MSIVMSKSVVSTAKRRVSAATDRQPIVAESPVQRDIEVSKTARRPRRMKERLVAEIQRLSKLRIDFVPSAEFAEIDRTLVNASLDVVELEADSVGVCASANPEVKTGLLTSRQEASLFKWMNYYRYSAAQKQKQLNVADADRRQVQTLRADLERATLIREQIIQANQGLVHLIARRAATSPGDVDDLVSIGNMSLMVAVDRFNYSLGFRFSTYATRVLQRAIFRVVAQTRRNRTRFHPTDVNLLRETVDYRETGHDADRLTKLARALTPLFAALDDRERLVVKARFGLGSGDRVRTLQELAGELHVCKERVRQLETRALRKLHQGAIAHRIEAPDA